MIPHHTPSGPLSDSILSEIQAYIQAHGDADGRLALCHLLPMLESIPALSATLQPEARQFLDQQAQASSMDTCTDTSAVLLDLHDVLGLIQDLLHVQVTFPSSASAPFPSGQTQEASLLEQDERNALADGSLQAEHTPSMDRLLLPTTPFLPPTQTSSYANTPFVFDRSMPGGQAPAAQGDLMEFSSMQRNDTASFHFFAAHSTAATVRKTVQAEDPAVEVDSPSMVAYGAQDGSLLNEFDLEVSGPAVSSSMIGTSPTPASRRLFGPTGQVVSSTEQGVLEGMGEALKTTTSPPSNRQSPADMSFRMGEIERMYKDRLQEKDRLVSELETRLAQLDTDLAQYKQDLNEKKQSEKRHVEELRALEETRCELQSELNQWKTAHDQLKVNMEGMKNDDTILNELLNDKEQELAELQAQFDNLTQQLDDSRVEVAELKMSLASYEQELETLRAVQPELESAQSENVRLKEELERMQSDLNEMKGGQDDGLSRGSPLLVSRKSLHSELQPYASERGPDISVIIEDVPDQEMNNDPSELQRLKASLEEAETNVGRLTQERNLLMESHHEQVRQMRGEIEALKASLLKQSVPTREAQPTQFPLESRGVSFNEPELFQSPAPQRTAARNGTALECVSPIPRNEFEDSQSSFVSLMMPPDEKQEAPFTTSVNQMDDQESKQDHGNADQGADKLDKTATDVWNWFNQIGHDVNALEKNVRELVQDPNSPHVNQAIQQYVRGLGGWLTKLKSDTEAVLHDTLAEYNQLKMQKSKLKHKLQKTVAEKETLLSKVNLMLSEQGRYQEEIGVLKMDVERLEEEKHHGDQAVHRLRQELSSVTIKCVSLETQLETVTTSISNKLRLSIGTQTELTRDDLAASDLTIRSSISQAPGSAQKFTEIIRKRNHELAAQKAQLEAMLKELRRLQAENHALKQNLASPQRERVLRNIKPSPLSSGGRPLFADAVMNSETQTFAVSQATKQCQTDEDATLFTSSTVCAPTPATKSSLFGSMFFSASFSLYSAFIWIFGALMGIWLVSTLIRANVVRVVSPSALADFEYAFFDHAANMYPTDHMGGFEPYDLGLDEPGVVWSMVQEWIRWIRPFLGLQQQQQDNPWTFPDTWTWEARSPI